MPEAGRLKDVISPEPSAADTQLRCNQIWAVSMPFTPLTREQAAGVVRSVRSALWTPCGLRTLDPADPDFHPVYGGPQKVRDMAYHQGTVWPFPLGGYYLAELRLGGFDEASCARVRRDLEALTPRPAGRLPGPPARDLRRRHAGGLPRVLCPGLERGRAAAGLRGAGAAPRPPASRAAGPAEPPPEERTHRRPQGPPGAASCILVVFLIGKGVFPIDSEALPSYLCSRKKGTARRLFP